MPIFVRFPRFSRCSAHMGTPLDNAKLGDGSLFLTQSISEDLWSIVSMQRGLVWLFCSELEAKSKVCPGPGGDTYRTCLKRFLLDN